MERALRNNLSEIFDVQALQHCPDLEASTDNASSCLWWQNLREDALKKIFKIVLPRKKRLQQLTADWFEFGTRYYPLTCLYAKQRLLQFSAMLTCQTQPADGSWKQLPCAERRYCPDSLDKTDAWEKTTAIFQLSGSKSLGPEETLDHYWKNKSCEVDKYAKTYTEFQSKQIQ